MAVERLTPAGDIDLAGAGVPAQLDEALRAATNTTDWLALAQRFALLRQMSGGHFDNLYLQARKKILHLVIVTRFGTSPLQEPWLRRAFDYAWPIVANSDDLLQRFNLPPAVQTVGRQLVTAYLPTSDPVAGAAASLLNAALSATLVNAGPNSVMLAICEAGVAPALVGSVNDRRILRKKFGLSLRPPYLAAVLWDVMSGTVHGMDQLGGGTLSPTQLRHSLYAR
ncbi:hypothetical protein ACSNN7_00855 [Micromonospora sp. URMC 105]|uniref:hypothetical protein n=1 Tax=Micromonospora sp. URMC 105 TaxID=3423413 RepID=UPI003F1A5CBE